MRDEGGRRRVEGGGLRVEGGENLQELALMKGGGAGDGYGLVACGEQTPAVGASFGNIERLAGF